MTNVHETDIWVGVTSPRTPQGEGEKGRNYGNGMMWCT